jgi:hypothetical protein
MWRADSVLNIGETVRCGLNTFITRWNCHPFAVVARFHPRLVPNAKIQKL